MSEQALRLADILDDLRRIHVSDSDIAIIMSPDESDLHCFCARQLSLRELYYAADVAALISADSDRPNHVILGLSTFMHNCMTVYTHLGDPLYLFCGYPFNRVYLFARPKELATYAASRQYKELELPFIGWADEMSSLSDGSLAALKYREHVVNLAHAVRDNHEELELALQNPEVLENVSVLLDAVHVCRCLVDPEQLGEFDKLCGAYGLVGL